MVNAMNDRDYEVYCQQLEPIMETLRPLIVACEAAGQDWRTTFSAEATRWERESRARGDNDWGRLAGNYATAHRLLLYPR